MHEFEGGPEVRGFGFGEEVAPGIEALEVGAICPDETALLIRDPGALLIADGIVRYGGELRFVSDWLLGDDPEGVKRGLREAYSPARPGLRQPAVRPRRPGPGRGKKALREFCA